MAVKLEEQNSVLVAKLSGRYLDQGEDYRGDFQTIYGDLQQKPRIVVISLGEVSDIDIRERALKIFAELYKKPIEVVKHDLEKIRRRKR